MYPTVNLFGIGISTYFLCAAAGITAAFALARRRCRTGKCRAPKELAFFAALMILPGAVFGAKLLQLFGNILTDGGEPYFWTWAYWKTLLPGAGVFYGGLLGGLCGALAGCRLFCIRFADFADWFTPGVPLFMTFGRLGCYLAGCCYGIVSDCAAAHIFSAPGATPRIPVQLLEAGVNLLLAALLARVPLTEKNRGRLFPTYAVCYAASRFVLEFFRGDAHRGVYILSTSQWISAGVCLAWCAAAVIRRRQRTARSHRQTGKGESTMPNIKKCGQILLGVLLIVSLASCAAGNLPAAPEQTSAQETVTEEARTAPADLPPETAEPQSDTTEPQSETAEPQTQEAEPRSELALPTDKAQIIRLYNDAVNRAVSQKASFTQWRKSTVSDKDYHASPILEPFKKKVLEFMGVNDGTQTEITSTTEDYDHYLQRASLRDTDVERATCAANKDGDVQIALNIRSGSSFMSRDVNTCDAPLNRTGIAVGDKDKAYWDHKTAQNVYHALESYAPTAKVDERYDNAVLTARVSPDGTLREINVQFNVAFDLSDIYGVGGNASGITEIRYSDFKA